MNIGLDELKKLPATCVQAFGEFVRQVNEKGIRLTGEREFRQTRGSQFLLEQARHVVRVPGVF